MDVGEDEVRELCLLTSGCQSGELPRRNEMVHEKDDGRDLRVRRLSSHNWAYEKADGKADTFLRTFGRSEADKCDQAGMHTENVHVPHPMT